MATQSVVPDKDGRKPSQPSINAKQALIPQPQGVNKLDVRLVNNARTHLAHAAPKHERAIATATLHVIH
jgi:hypothetical protein